MALLLKKFCKFYNWGMTDMADPRTSDLPLMQSSVYLYLITLSYVTFVLKIGPKYMRHRKPFNLNKVLVVYNATQVLYCLFLLYGTATTVLFKYDWRCAPVDYSNNKQAVYVANLVWYYFMLKVYDLLDTIFFVLRKKTSQVTFLHVYHHAGMVIMTWIATKFLAGGHCLYLGVINCIVHTFMYIYYLLTAYDSEYKKSLWWKKHITQLQLGQFTLITLIYGQILFRPDCTFPKWTQLLFLPQNLLMMMMFSDFYYKTYIRKPQIKPDDIQTEKQQ